MIKSQNHERLRDFIQWLMVNLFLYELEDGVNGVDDTVGGVNIGDDDLGGTSRRGDHDSLVISET